MKFFILLTLMVSFNITSIAQEINTFVVVDDNGVASISKYEEALAQADMDRYRYKNERRKLHFQSGVIIELFSVQEVISMGLTPNSQGTIKIEGNIEPIFILQENGYIIESHRSKGKFSGTNSSR